MNKYLLLTLACLTIKLSSSCKSKTSYLEKDNSQLIEKGYPLDNQVDKADSSFTAFWVLFRKAAIESDTNQLLRLVSFPIKTRGPLDNDPIIEYDAERIVHVLFAYLQQWDGIDLDGKTELDYIKKITNPKQKISNNRIRIGNMMFSLKNGFWKVDFLYLNNETIEYLEKKK